MLKQRVITAVILVVVLLAALFSLNSLYWKILISLMVLIGFWEWVRLCKLESPVLQIAAYALFVLCFYLLQAGYLSLAVVVPTACIVWGVLIWFTISDQFAFLHQPILKLLIGAAVLASSGWLVIELKEIDNGPYWILCFMLSVWAADIGAYFVGRRFGKTKLAPKVSPGKTVEGLVGGLLLVVLVFVPLLFSLFAFKAAVLLLLTVLLTAVISVGGDLFESKLKRYADLKDSSQILPGHGGVLDRIDSLLAGAPFFSLGLISLGYL